MPRVWEAEESGLFLGYVGGLFTPATRQDASGNQKHTWGSLPGPSATRPPACAHSDTGKQHRLRNKASFCSHCNRKPAFGKPSFIWKKGKELSGCLHSTKKKKVTKTKPHPLQSRVVWERPSRNWASFLYLPERHMAGSYSRTKLSLNSRSEGHGGAGRGAVRTGPALSEVASVGSVRRTSRKQSYRARNSALQNGPPTALHQSAMTSGGGAGPQICPPVSSCNSGHISVRKGDTFPPVPFV